ncbi:hypothetical protein D3C78_1417630 [compost metagenome]
MCIDGQATAEILPGNFGTELKVFTGLDRERAAVEVAVVIVTSTGPDKPDGVTVLVQVHMPRMPFSGQLGHGLHAVTKVLAECLGVVLGDVDSAQTFTGAQFVRGNRRDQVALHPQQFTVSEHVTFPQRAKGAAQAFLFDAQKQVFDDAHDALRGASPGVLDGVAG